MEEAFVTLSVAADLEGIKYNTMVQRISRRQKDFITKTERVESGGKDAVFVSVSSLSRPARAAYEERQKLQKVAAITPDDMDQEEQQRPWYVDMDIDWYMDKHREDWYKAMELGNIVREFLSYDDCDKALYAEKLAQEQLGKGQRTLYRYVKTYLAASAWADKLQKETGCNYEFVKVLCLCRKPKESGTFPSFSPEVKTAIRNIWLNPEFACNNPTIEMLYDKLLILQKLQGWEKLPSYQSVVRYMSYLKNEDGEFRSAWNLAREGIIEWRNKHMVKASRDTHSLKVMEIVMGDAHTFDCWVAYKQPNGKVTAIRPHIVVWIDVRSRAIMGDVMCKDVNADILKESVLKMVYSNPGGVPGGLYIDNGKDYTSRMMTGQSRKERTMREEDPYSEIFDDATRGFYRSIGIKEYHRALPYQGWSKGQVERFFGTLCNRFTKWFASYTGTLTGSRTDGKVNKDIKGMLERGELLTLEEFYSLWSSWLSEKYMNHKHGGLKKAGEIYKTPYDCFVEEERYEVPIPSRSQATIFMMKSDRVRVNNIGIRKFGQEYRSEELCNYINQTVSIKYDPYDLSTLYVFQSGRQVCEAYSQELLQMTEPVSERTLKHINMQRNQERKAREMIRDAKAGLKEMQEQVAAYNPTVGGIDLIITAKKKQAKVVQMPQEVTYRNGFRGKAAEKEETQSGYIDQKAEEALKRLRAL